MGLCFKIPRVIISDLEMFILYPENPLNAFIMSLSMGMDKSGLVKTIKTSSTGYGNHVQFVADS